MGNLILLTRPEHDDTTFYCSSWAAKVKEAAEHKGLDVIDLRKERANRAALENILREKQPRFAFFNGHGDEGSIRGHRDEVLVDGSNKNILNSKIVYTIACKSANKLGMDAVSAGAVAYIGFIDDFVFIWDTNRSATPLRDEIAKPFFESSNTIPAAIINGVTSEEAVARSLKTYDYWINYYMLHGDIPEAPQILMALMWDRINLRLCGNPGASL